MISILHLEIGKYNVMLQIEAMYLGQILRGGALSVVIASSLC